MAPILPTGAVETMRESTEAMTPDNVKVKRFSVTSKNAAMKNLQESGYFRENHNGRNKLGTEDDIKLTIEEIRYEHDTWTSREVWKKIHEDRVNQHKQNKKEMKAKRIVDRKLKKCNEIIEDTVREECIEDAVRMYEDAVREESDEDTVREESEGSQEEMESEAEKMEEEEERASKKSDEDTVTEGCRGSQEDKKKHLLEVQLSEEELSPEEIYLQKNFKISLEVYTEYMDCLPASTQSFWNQKLNPEIEAEVSGEHPEIEAEVSGEHPEIEAEVSGEHPEIEAEVSHSDNGKSDLELWTWHLDRRLKAFTRPIQVDENAVEDANGDNKPSRWLEKRTEDIENMQDEANISEAELPAHDKARLERLVFVGRILQKIRDLQPEVTSDEENDGQEMDDTDRVIDRALTLMVEDFEAIMCNSSEEYDPESLITDYPDLVTALNQMSLNDLKECIVTNEELLDAIHTADDLSDAHRAQLSEWLLEAAALDAVQELVDAVDGGETVTVGELNDAADNEHLPQEGLVRLAGLRKRLADDATTAVQDLVDTVNGGETVTAAQLDAAESEHLPDESRTLLDDLRNQLKAIEAVQGLIDRVGTDNPPTSEDLNLDGVDISHLPAASQATLQDLRCMIGTPVTFDNMSSDDWLTEKASCLRTRNVYGGTPWRENWITNVWYNFRTWWDFGDYQFRIAHQGKHDIEEGPNMFLIGLSKADLHESQDGIGEPEADAKARIIRFEKMGELLDKLDEAIEEPSSTKQVVLDSMKTELEKIICKSYYTAGLKDQTELTVRTHSNEDWKSFGFLTYINDDGKETRGIKKFLIDNQEDFVDGLSALVRHDPEYGITEQKKLKECMRPLFSEPAISAIEECLFGLSKFQILFGTKEEGDALYEEMKRIDKFNLCETGVEYDGNLLVGDKLLNIGIFGEQKNELLQWLEQSKMFEDDGLLDNLNPLN